jgi:hypothetical protein
MAYQFNWDSTKESAEKLLQWIYWIVGLMIVGSVSYFLYKNNKQVAGVLVFMAGMMAVYFYYVKWFIVAADSTWPPVIGACPDFLTQLPIKSNDNTIYCVDRVGVSISKSGGFVSSVGETRDPTEEPVAKNSPKVFYYNSNDTTDSICTKVTTKGLTWVSRCNMV